MDGNMTLTEKQWRRLKMKMEGMTLREIAAREGVDRQSVWDSLNASMVREARDKLFALQGQAAVTIGALRAHSGKPFEVKAVLDRVIAEGLKALKPQAGK